MALSISIVSLQKCYSEKFTANSHFTREMWKFSHIQYITFKTSNDEHVATNRFYQCTGELETHLIP